MYTQYSHCVACVLCEMLGLFRSNTSSIQLLTKRLNKTSLPIITIICCFAFQKKRKRATQWNNCELHIRRLILLPRQFTLICSSLFCCVSFKTTDHRRRWVRIEVILVIVLWLVNCVCRQVCLYERRTLFAIDATCSMNILTIFKWFEWNKNWIQLRIGWGVMEAARNQVNRTARRLQLK